MMINLGSDVNMREESNKGCTALHMAAINGRVGTMQVLVQLGAHLHALNFDRCNALHAAAAHGQVRQPSTPQMVPISHVAIHKLFNIASHRLT